MAAKKTSTELKRVGTISGTAALAELDKIEKEFPTDQLGRSLKHDLMSNGGNIRNMHVNYANFQVESARLSAEKSRAKTKLKNEAVNKLIEIRDILGPDEVLRILTEEGV